MVSPRRRIPTVARIERDLPVEALIPLAVREGNRKKPVYEIHKWWARRLGSNFRMMLIGAMKPETVSSRELWSEFYSRHQWKNLVVCDPFMGGGTSVVEATKLGAKVIGNDIDPVAWLVTKKEIEPADIEMLQYEFQRIEKAVADDIKQFYKHKLPDGTQADVTTYFWVTLVKCPTCGRELEAHPHYQLYIDTDEKRQAVFCRSCHEIAWLGINRRSFTCKQCGVKTVIGEGIVKLGEYKCECGHTGKMLALTKPGQPLDNRIFALEYEVVSGERRDFAKACNDDIALFEAAKQELERHSSELPFPRQTIPVEGRYDNRPINYGYAKYEQLFNPRQLLALSRIYTEILKVEDKSIREYLLLAFSDALASNNMLCSYAFGYRKLTPLFGLHAYRIVTRPVEGNVWGTIHGRGSFEKCVEKLIRGKRYCNKPYENFGDLKDRRFTGEKIAAEVTANPEEWYAGKAQSLLLNMDAKNLASVRGASVDLILTDPPYYSNISYSEMSDFYYVWLRGALPGELERWLQPSTPFRDALFVRRRTEEEHDRFSEGMKAVFKECHRILKPNGMMVFTYHHNDRRAWNVMARAIIEGGFRVTNVLPVLSEGKSGFHSETGNIKWDSVIVCRPNIPSKGCADPPEEIAEFAMRNLEIWKNRIKRANRRLSRADSVSLAMAFGVWKLSQAQPGQEEITRVLNKVLAKASRSKVTPSLFRPAPAKTGPS